MFKRILLWLSLLMLPLVAVGGFYGYLYWKVSSALDELAARIAPVAELSYQSVRVDLLETRIDVGDLYLQPVGAEDRFTLERLGLSTADWSEMLLLADRLATRKWPQQITLELHGFEFSLEGEFMSRWMDMAKAQNQMHQVPQIGAFCGGQNDPEIFRAMGYRQLRSNLTLSSAFDADKGVWSFAFSGNTERIGRFSTGIEFDVSGEELSARTLTSGIALRKLTTSYRDTGFNIRFRKYCTDRLQLKDGEFEMGVRGDYEALMRFLGVRLADAHYEALVDIYKPGGNIDFNLRPPVALGQHNVLQIDSLNAFMERVNPSLNVAGKQVALADIQLGEPQRQPAKAASVGKQPLPGESVGRSDSGGTSLSSAAPPAVDNAPAEEAYELRKPAFIEIDVEDVELFKGKRARMLTYFGRRVEGRILQVREDAVLIEQRMERGVATYTIALDKIAELEVYR